MLDGSTPYFCEVAHKRAENIKKEAELPLINSKR
jgi:hypothetical protein